MNEEEIISLFYSKSQFESHEILMALAEKGNAIAQYFLGLMHLSPIDQTIEMDKDKGLMFIKIAAKNNHIPALEYLGNLYAYSDLVDLNPQKSHTYFYLVALKQNSTDIGYHQIIEDEFKLSKAEIMESMAKAVECMKESFDNCYLFN